VQVVAALKEVSWSWLMYSGIDTDHRNWLPLKTSFDRCRALTLLSKIS
jgi:hypothetical protein